MSSLLFVTVMEVLTCDASEGLAWELLYVAGFFLLVAENMEELKEKALKWKDRIEAKGLNVNISKTKVMVSGKNCDDVQRTGKWLCTVCGKGIRGNSVQCRCGG